MIPDSLRASVYVEKRSPYNAAATRQLDELRELLEIPELKVFRRFIRYDLFGIQDNHVQEAIAHVLSDPITDVVTADLTVSQDMRAFAIEYLPGQFDQRADSAAEAIEILTSGFRPTVRVCEVYMVNGDLPDSSFHRIRNHLLNPVDSRFCDPFAPPEMPAEAPVPADIPLWDHVFTDTEPGLAMSADDLEVCRRYFQDEEGRSPTETEIRVLDTYWSDHCRHTTFETHLERIDISGEGPVADRLRRAHRRFLELRERYLPPHRVNAPPTLMELATIVGREFKSEGRLEDLLVSEEINAATVRINVETTTGPEEWYLLFKNETHNHPTEIEPVGGAETCLGGAIRDPLSGRAYVHQAIRVTGSADPRLPVADTRPGKLPQRTITTLAARGFSSYGNQIGLSTGVVHEYYHPGYEAKRMEIGAVLGAAPVEQVHHRRPVPGDVVILVGGRTGRDGCGGATGSSKAHDVSSVTEASAEVQKGNPPVERALQRFFRNPDVSRRVKRANDFGAGGVSVAVGEIADGLVIDLDAVPVKYGGLNGTELAISESQERMAIVVDPEDVQLLTEHAVQENLEATVIATVTETPRLVMRWRNRTLVDISREFLASNGAKRRASATIIARLIEEPHDSPTFTSHRQRWLDAVANLQAASRKGLSELFDSTIGAGTLLAPWGGRYGLTPNHVAAARIPHPRYDTSTASMGSYGFFPSLSEKSPFHGAFWSVVESVARIVCAGGRRSNIRLSFQEYFPRLGNDPERWGLPCGALLGAMEAQEALGTPAIGGKDSMSGSFEDLDVPPTLVAFSFCAEEEIRIVGPELLPRKSVLLAVVPKVEPDGLPQDGTLTEQLDLVESAVGDGVVCAAGTIGEAGAIAAVATAALGNWCTLRLDEEAVYRIDRRCGLDVSSVVSLYLQIPDEKISEAKALLDSPQTVILGEVDGEEEPAILPSDRWGPYGDTPFGAIYIGKEVIRLSDLRDAWMAPLNGVFPLPRNSTDGAPAIEHSEEKDRPKRPGRGTATPKVCIPVFPGTNCEYDTARAFSDAGAVPVTPVFRKHSPDELSASIDELAHAIKESQILMFPGGFSAGDEPDGSGKYIAAVFRDPRLMDTVADLITRRDGLILGICNGFQALVRMGLLPGGVDDMDQPPRIGLFMNTGLQHISTFVHTRVVDNSSPWLAGTDPSQTYTVPISHGEGRLIASEEQLEALRAGGQIATQYVEYNPNGSVAAIEGITSPDGRILGKMAHNERVRPGLYRNLPVMADMKIFENGVSWFN